MSAQKLALFTAAALMAACATSQENPQYQYSTKYKGDSPHTAYAVNSVPYSTGANQANTQQAVYQSVNEPINQPLHQPLYQPLAQTQNVSPAAYETTVYAAPSYSRVDAACIEQGLQNTAGCAPNAVAINGQSASVATPYNSGAQTLYVTSQTTTAIAPSPTEQAMPESYGTPGYEAMKNAESGWDVPAPATPTWEPVQSAPTAPESQVRGYAAAAPVGSGAVPMTEPFASPLPAPEARSAEIYSARSPNIAPQYEQNFTLGTQHEIQQGDTVYSFARKLCSSVSEIKAMNSLDGNFSIRMGETIRLPASKC